MMSRSTDCRIALQEPGTVDRIRRPPGQQGHIGRQQRQQHPVQAGPVRRSGSQDDLLAADLWPAGLRHVADRRDRRLHLAGRAGGHAGSPSSRTSVRVGILPARSASTALSSFHSSPARRPPGWPCRRGSWPRPRLPHRACDRSVPTGRSRPARPPSGSLRIAPSGESRPVIGRSGILAPHASRSAPAQQPPPRGVRHRRTANRPAAGPRSRLVVRESRPRPCAPMPPASA